MVLSRQHAIVLRTALIVFLVCGPALYILAAPRKAQHNYALARIRAVGQQVSPSKSPTDAPVAPSLPAPQPSTPPPSAAAASGVISVASQPSGSAQAMPAEIPASQYEAKSVSRKVAVLIVGKVNAEVETRNTVGHLIRPLIAEFGATNVHLYLCVDTPNAARVQSMKFGPAAPLRVFQHDIRDGKNVAKTIWNPQWARLAMCYDEVKAYATKAGHFNYEWFVRSRPDTLFFGDAPSPLEDLPIDTVHAPARVIGGSRMEEINPIDDIWAYAGAIVLRHTLHSSCNFGCTRQPKGPTPCAGGERGLQQSAVSHACHLCLFAFM